MNIHRAEATAPDCVLVVVMGCAMGVRTVQQAVVLGVRQGAMVGVQVVAGRILYRRV